MDRVFLHLYDIPEVTKGCDFSGMTDPAILRDLFLRFRGRDSTARELEQMKEAYLRFLEDEVESSPGFRVLPGVLGLLGQLSPRKDVLSGIATGNLERGAQAKLRRAGLVSYFRFGGYGSDSEDRPTIVSLAVERAKNLLGGPSDSHMAFVIGDTPLDIQAGKAAGTLTVAIASGNKPYEELKSHQPTYLFRDLSPTEEFLRILS
jgi:phosphoglycolate phosphatase-like HAD superfamily hydrolase